MMDLFEQIKKDEGFRRYPYQCSAGAWTVGYGRNIDANHGGPGVSEDEAHHMLRNDIAKAERHLKEVFPNWLTMGTVRQNALINMCLNLGAGGFSRFVNMISAIKRGYWGKAGFEARDSRWFVQVGRRAERVAQEIETGVAL